MADAVVGAGEVAARSGDKLWVKEESQKANSKSKRGKKRAGGGTWVLVEFEGQRIAEDGSVTLNFAGGELPSRTFPKDHYAHYNPSHERVDHEDLSKIDDLHEAPMVAILESRFKLGKIYTNAGDVVISINPFQDIAGMYDLPVADESLSHIFSVTKKAFEALSLEEKNQAILVNGTSGSGKTEATKLMIRHLVWMTNQFSSSSLVDKIQDIVLTSNAAFEAFGNAVTVHNHNSSRFGKFIRLEFSDGNRFISSAHASHFLLEKTRLVARGEGESNFHVFYQLVQDCEEDMFQRLCLPSRNVEDYGFLRGSVSISPRPGLEDTTGALEMIGEDVEEIYRVLSAVLLLGNVDFEADGEQGAATVSGDSSILDVISALLCLDDGRSAAAKSLASALTVRTTVAGGGGGRRHSVQTIHLSVAQAKESRNGLAKFLYSAIFDELFHTFNRSAGGSDGSDPFVGFLDIFGFEIFDRNSVEQLCINYANEALQRVFNNYVFQKEMSIYAEENVDISDVKFEDNGRLIALIESAFSFLDEQTMFGQRGSDNNLLSNLTRSHGAGKNSHYGVPRFGSGEAFIIKHYAGPVEYKIEGFVSKNNDSLHSNLLSVVRFSSSPLLRRILNLDDANTAATPEAVRKLKLQRASSTTSMSGGNKLLGSMTVCRALKSEIQSLRRILERSSCHFVRCVMPNSRTAPAPEWDQGLVLSQLNYLGVIETCRIRRQGYPVRRKYAEILAEYSELLELIVGAEIPDEPVARCCLILERVLGEGGWRAGSNFAFMRDGKIDELNVALQNLRVEKIRKLRDLSARTMQAGIRRILASRRADRMREEKRRLEVERQRRIEREERERFEEERRKLAEKERRRFDAAQRLQGLARRLIAKKIFEKLKHDRLRMNAATKLQSFHRKRHQSRVYRAKKRLVTSLQSFHRTRSVGRNFRKKKSAATLLQAATRARLGRLEMRDKRSAACTLQSFWRMRMKSSRYHDIQGARLMWKKALDDNEFILYASLVQKRAEKGVAKVLGFKRRRQLLLTSKQRLLYVCPDDRRARGQISLRSMDSTKCVGLSPKISSEFQIDGQVFVNLLGSGMVWKEVVRNFENRRVLTPSFMKGGRREMGHARLTQGFLLKKSGSAKGSSSSNLFARKWNKRWFVLHSGKLYWFGSRGSRARGCIAIDASSSVVESADKNFGFKVITDDLPMGIPLAAPDAAARRMWLSELRRAVLDIKGCRSSSHTKHRPIKTMDFLFDETFDLGGSDEDGGDEIEV